MQVCGFLSGDFDACSASCPASSADLVEDVPRYYTCGPSGSWEMLQDQGGLYPTCGRKLLFLLLNDIVGIVAPARMDVCLHMNCNITTSQCFVVCVSVLLSPYGCCDCHKPVFRCSCLWVWGWFFCCCFCPCITFKSSCRHWGPEGSRHSLLHELPGYHKPVFSCLCFCTLITL